MNWPDSISEALPPERDDEPASLRDDIADELADHLEAAFARERSRCGEDAAARQAVLNRFGDPTSICRRLWFDAMKGKIMLQRFAVVTQAILAVCCLGALGLMWQMMRQNQQVNLVFQERLAELVLKSNPAAMEWTSLKIRCVSGSENKPVADCLIGLNGRAVSAHESASLQQTTKADGIVFFETIRVGKYDLELIDVQRRSNRRSVVLFPGEPTEVTIVCPPPGSETAEINFDVSFEKVADGAPTLATLQFLYEGESVDGHRWKRLTSSPFVVLSAHGKVLYQRFDATSSSKPFDRTSLSVEDAAALNDSPNLVNWPPGEYRLVGFQIDKMKKASESDTRAISESTLKRYDTSMANEFGPFMATIAKPNHWKIDSVALAGSGEWSRK